VGFFSSMGGEEEAEGEEELLKTKNITISVPNNCPDQDGMWQKLKNSKQPIRRLGFQLDPCPRCKEEDVGFFSSMGGEEEAEGEEELLKTKNITISVPKTNREIRRENSWLILFSLIDRRRGQRRDLILFLDARRRRRRRRRKEEAVDQLLTCFLIFFRTPNET